ncbi:hypothetical protein Q3G72_001690 [Acer saccharum]|nr:hypothetical protein Q3G72_001690 [Acer saccharum]
MPTSVADNQIEGAVYVCELCQKHSKSVGSLPSTEDGKIEVASPQFELQTVNSDPSISPQPTWRHDAPHELSFIYQPSDASSPLQGCPPLSENCRKKYAWSVAPDSSQSTEIDWKRADRPFDPLQYQQQTDGFDVSLSYLKTVFAQQQPFDGILGFSQGAAMAASICALRERLKGELDFRFGILCSGYALPSTEIQPGSINCPSLHIFGSDLGKDRQTANQASRDLAMAFENGCYAIIEHDCGHFIPTRSPYIDEIKGFLQHFLYEIRISFY